jgi:hypothetical protein
MKLFPPESVVVKQSGEESALGLTDGSCNMIAGGVSDVSVSNVKELGHYVGEYEAASALDFRDPLAMVTRQDDPQFSAFVYWIVSSTFFAEEKGITKDSASTMPDVHFFGFKYTDMFQNAIAAVGSYAEIYDRNVDEDLPRFGMNLLNDDPIGPQHYPFYRL